MNDKGSDNMTGSPDPLAEIMRAVGRRQPPPEAHYDQVYAAARRAWRGKLGSRRRRRWFALAASIAVVLAAGGLARYLVVDEAVPVAGVTLARGDVEYRLEPERGWQPLVAADSVLFAGMALRTGVSAGVALELANGGSIRLDERTQIRVASANGLELSAGRVYFDSADGRSEPLEIRTAGGVVRDVGTQYEVSFRPQSLRLRVREGTVVLVDSAAGAELLGRVGEEIVVEPDGRVERDTIAPDDPDWAWAEALASAPRTESRSILRYFRWIARETGKRLEFEPSTIEIVAELASFSGDPTGLTPLELLGSIAATSDFNYVLTADGAILIRRD